MTDIVVGPDWDKRIVSINQEGRVGIVMSGGIDSFVLYHLLKDPIIFCIKRKDGMDSPERVKLLTGKEVIEVDEVTTENEWRVSKTSELIVEEYKIDQLYNGSNMIPPIHLFPEFSEGYSSRPFKFFNPKIKAPFNFLYKYHTINLAQRMNIDLTNTLSCIILPDRECGKCWHCREKVWGFTYAN